MSKVYFVVVLGADRVKKAIQVHSFVLKTTGATFIAWFQNHRNYFVCRSIGPCMSSMWAQCIICLLGFVVSLKVFLGCRKGCKLRSRIWNVMKQELSWTLVSFLMMKNSLALLLQIAWSGGISQDETTVES